MTDKHEKRKDKRKYCNLYVKSTIYGKSLIFYLNNKYFTTRVFTTDYYSIFYR